VLGLSVAAARRPGWAVGALLVPVVAFPRYALEARRRGRPVVASFAYLQLLEEAASDIGFVAGWWHFRKAAELGR
jgi:hypothetical protein